MVDPVDVRLLGVVADMGRAAVHEVAARLGMDPREVASRLIALSGSGLPLLVGVECDPNGLRQALARQGAYSMPGQYQQQPPQQQPGYPPQYQQQNAQQPNYPGQQSGPYQVNPQSAPFQSPMGPPSQPFPVQAPQQNHQQNPGPQNLGQQNHQQNHNPPSQPFPAVSEPMSTWGPPQVSTWARGDQPPAVVELPSERTQPTTRSAASRQGTVGNSLETTGLEGERLAVRLVEVMDPADYLFTAAGYTLREGERSVVVHTELTNRGSVPFATLPDLYLVLVTPEGETVGKAPVSLSSRPAHRIGVAPGETAGGHTVYVVPEDMAVTSVRWSPRPDEEDLALTWAVDN